MAWISTAKSRTMMLGLALLALPARAQISLTSAVGLALGNSPRVKVAQAEVEKAQAALSQTRDVYIPALAAGAGIGQSYGYSSYPPTLFTFSAGSLVYNASQYSYIRSARTGVAASLRTLDDAREAVAEDAALTFVALARDQQREGILKQQMEYSGQLLTIVQERFDAGRDSKVDVTTAKLATAQLRLASLRARDETMDDRDHLGRLIGVSVASLRAEGGLPEMPVANALRGAGAWANPAVAAAFLSARAKQETAYGDSRYLFRPQVSLVVQYNRYATFTDTFKQLQAINNGLIGANEGVFGVQITVPVYDRLRRAKNVESTAEASRALHEAESAQAIALDGQGKLRHAIEQLSARAEVAGLQQQLAQQQLEIVQIQLQGPPPVSGQVMTPKDEQNARIAEREKALAVLDTTFQLQQATINLMRQTGGLEEWLKSALRKGAGQD